MVTHGKIYIKRRVEMSITKSGNPLINGVNALTITNNATTNAVSKAVYIGANISFDFCFEHSTWVQFSTLPVATILPIQVKGARISSSEAAPEEGNIVFIY